MRRQSVQTITYNDLVDLAQELVKGCQERYDGAKARGTSNLGPLTHKLETAKTLRRMLEKGRPVKQTNLFILFESMKP